LNSTISFFNGNAPFNAIEEFKDEYRCITMDLCNANGGQSSGPLEVDRPWDAHAVAMEVVHLAPKAEVSLYPWKGPKDLIPQAVRHVRDFLRAHHPKGGPVDSTLFSSSNDQSTTEKSGLYMRQSHHTRAPRRERSIA
jgi:hypothetical protein